MQLYKNDTVVTSPIAKLWNFVLLVFGNWSGTIFCVETYLTKIFFSLAKNFFLMKGENK